MKQSWVVPASLFLLGGLVLSLYFFFEPREGSWFPKCPVYATTGLKCPGCGAQRSVHALLNGEAYKAFWYNPLFWPGITWISLVYGLKAFRKRSAAVANLHDRLTGTVSHYIWIIILVSYWVLRNTLGF